MLALAACQGGGLVESRTQPLTFSTVSAESFGTLDVAAGSDVVVAGADVVADPVDAPAEPGDGAIDYTQIPVEPEILEEAQATQPSICVSAE